jgi:predicted nucleic acid-binding protein
LVDTRPLVALCDTRDRLHAPACKDLDRLARRPLVVCDAVLTEAFFLLPGKATRSRLERLFGELGLRPLVLQDEAQFRSDAFGWMARYADQQPDWADACLAVVSQREKRARVWTYDSEFRTTWRRPDGTRIALAVESRAAR